MSALLFSISLAIFTLAKGDTCSEQCKLPDCLCASTDVPNGLDSKQIPQIVMLTFDDAVQALNHKFYDEALKNLKNPDGCSVSATFFVSHDYTDYSKVHQLHQSGHEIALHSITHNSDTKYWREASVDLLKQEFGGERDLISHFANVPSEDLRGIRIPFLQMSGDNSTRAIKELGLEYDCSWPTRTYVDPGLWPYTLDYQSIQDCPIGPCPTKPTPGLWVQPMIDWKDFSDIPCAMADACVDVPKTVDGIYEFMVKNFKTQYEGNRAPVGVYLHAAWFQLDENHFPAYKKFIQYLAGLGDVYMVNLHRALQWVRNPQTLENLKTIWPKCNEPEQTSCSMFVCQLQKGEETHYMTQCANTCPKNYPWLGNPLGN